MLTCISCGKTPPPNEIRTRTETTASYCRDCYMELPFDQRFFPEEWIKLWEREEGVEKKETVLAVHNFLPAIRALQGIS